MMSDPSTKLISWTETNTDEDLRRCVARLAEADGPADEAGTWPEALWNILIDAKATRWALPQSDGGADYDRTELLERYARVTAGSMTAAFILTQHDSALRRLVAARNRPVADQWIKAIAQDGAFTTVGISQLTTSRRHGAQALRAAERPGGGYRLDGTMPWVTAAERANVLVTGAVTGDGQQLLIALPTERTGVTIPPPFSLAALQASRTTEVVCHEVDVTAAEVLVGPLPNVIATPGAAGTGGLETSALALGQARAALEALIAETPSRTELDEPAEALADAWNELWFALMKTAREEADALTTGQIRAQANALVLRATQAYLTVRKGTGFLRTDPAQRWARQALFFLVWSCPSPVAQASIRDFAGLCSN
jgi:butyryl-CoA dehydrogenase